MTPRRRRDVVALLRCAADLGLCGVPAPLTEAAHRLGYAGKLRIREHPIVAEADRAMMTLDDDRPTVGPSWESFGADLLEIALRVEERVL